MRFAPGLIYAVKIVTWDPSTVVNGSLSNGNLTITATANACVVLGNEARKSGGKFYFEVKISAVGGGSEVGIATAAEADSWYYLSTGQIGHNGSGVASGSSFTSGDTISVAVDVSSDLIYFAKNGAWQAGGNPSLGTGGISIAASSWFPFFSSASSAIGIANFGATTLSYALPTGFVAWQS